VCTHIFLGKVNKILQVDVITVGLYIVVDEKVELVFDPVFKDEGKDPRSQLQEEDQTQEHRKLTHTNETHKQKTINLSLQSGTLGAPQRDPVFLKIKT